jgi:hypothetical protein
MLEYSSSPSPNLRTTNQETVGSQFLSLLRDPLEGGALPCPLSQGWLTKSPGVAAGALCANFLVSGGRLAELSRHIIGHRADLLHCPLQLVGADAESL